jgi:hypothetical protein
MIADLDRRISEIRFLEGVEKVEHVPYQSGDQFWVRFNRPFDIAKLSEIVKKHGLVMVPFAALPSKLPRGLGELLWDGVTHVIAKKISGWSSFTSKFGFEPDGIAKLAIDLHGSYRIFMALDEQGIQLLYEYLGVNYVPPAPPPPKPAAAPPAKPASPAAAKPAQLATPQPAPAPPPAQAKPATAEPTSSAASNPNAGQPPPKQEDKKDSAQPTA